MQQTYDYLIKTIVAGDSGVGKTSTLNRYCDHQVDNFIMGHFATVENKVLYAQMWDTAGMERYRAISAPYYKNASAALILFDITNSNSFKNIDSWLIDVGKFAPPDVCKILLGNKCDLAQSRAVPYEEAYAKAKLNGIEYLDICAKTGENVSQAFESLWLSFLHSPSIPPIVQKEAKKEEEHKIGALEKLKSFCTMY